MADSDYTIKIPTRRRAVLVVTPYYAQHGGGPERVAGQLIKDIAASGSFHFTWAASNCSIPQAAKPGDEKNFMLLPMRALNHLEKLFGLRWPVWTHRSLKQLRRAIEGVDCLWLHDTFSLGSLIAFVIARRKQKPILITKHEGPPKHPGALQRLWTAALDRTLTRSLLSKAQQATFTADAAAEFYHRRVGFNAPVKIIPNGVDFSVFNAPSPERRTLLRARFALRQDQPVMLYSGRFTNENGLAAIRELAKLMPDWRFWLAGEGPVQPEKWFLPNVQALRGRRDEKLAELYQAADLLILPGYQQGFPLAAQEAMACGLPLMCGPAAAGGSDFAKPYLWVVDVDPARPEKTAAVWASKLKAARSILPLTEAKTELSELAESYWEWPRIAGYYEETLQGMCKGKG